MLRREANESVHEPLNVSFPSETVRSVGLYTFFTGLEFKTSHLTGGAYRGQPLKRCDPIFDLYISALFILLGQDLNLYL